MAEKADLKKELKHLYAPPAGQFVIVDVPAMRYLKVDGQGDPNISPESLRLETLDEGLCVQIMHVGSYDEEGPVLAKLHNEFLPQNGLAETGHHHEIYIGDPRKTAPERLRTVLRQPVRRIT